LDQFDLDEHFASERIRLAQLTNKCATDDDIDFYIREAGEVSSGGGGGSSSSSSRRRRRRRVEAVSREKYRQ